MKTKNLAIYQGDTYLFKVALTSETGEPLQTDGLSFALAVKFPDGATITPELTVDGNIVSLLFPSALTAAITHTTAEYDLRAISGQYVKTYLRGQLHITPSITPVTAGDGGEIHEEAVSVAVSEAAIIRAAGNQSQTAYDDSEIKQRLAALESRQDQDTVFDDSDLKRRLTALESHQDQDTVYDDSDLKRRLTALEGRQDQDTVYDDSELKRRLAALEGRQDQDTVYDDSDIKRRLEALEYAEIYLRTYDDSDLKRRLTALESHQDQDIVYDDSDLKRRLTALENRPAPKAESPYSEIQEGYIARENFGFVPENNTPATVSFPKPFSRRPDIFEACLDIRSNSARLQYIQNVTASGFDMATNYSPELKGVWYRAAILKSQ
nr:MAG TPA: BppU domain protein [Caudoviricetes sp.]